ncbi:hypothetical protein G8S49_11375 [Clostridium botulinum C]|uniref:Uncharacterized protein n=1 Tax=Clostridium botulinum C TaxID=36828 RepID=A0A9Q3VBQ3_CLOBO|nr:hypothetical protein [Clostridium botulinum]MCD3195754.1 hypothetical protein [Clostridium botulinum C]MCD3201170.1 hypothetical protein [Clostridium botulinum C]MCD3206660.1 hypothetical protein [Clostridium botulinum C]MCD3209341.1 hypothetical protein [Clostridium botulinum C]MCD3226473.1 hypothetical protein [Clostridium botulinum C]
MPTFNLSFKKKSKDMELYIKVMEKEEKSEFIKECIAFYLENKENKKVEK